MINVYSEIGRLKKVLLHRPGRELDNLIPSMLDRLLFDEIPWLELAQEEHDAFADTLRNLGAEVVYLEDLVAELLDDSEIKEKFLRQFIEEANIKSHTKKQIVYEYLNNMENKDLVLTTMSGIRKTEIDLPRKRLADYVDKNPYVCDPLPNLYFTRDPFSSIGNGASVNHMKTVTRNRETIYADYIFKYHPEYKSTAKYYERDDNTSIEGGDILVLSEDVLAIGISERTEPESLEKIAKRLFSETSFKTILGFYIPNKRAFMHLDTVLTQVDYNKFTVHTGIQGPLEVYELTSDHGRIKIKEVNDKLENILSNYLNEDVTLIPCGGGDFIDSRREQWSDGANTLCVAPGEVIVYSRNTVTNKILEDYGVKIHVIPSSELSRGRGGPRCMSMPLIREREEK
ncbi:arginine deiminase [Mycoplasmatota bacterium WC44]